MHGKTVFRAMTIAVLSIGMTLPGLAQTAGQDMKTAGSDTKNAAKHTGRAVKHGAKTAARKTKNGTKKAYHSTKKATGNTVRGMEGKPKTTTGTSSGAPTTPPR